MASLLLFLLQVEDEGEEVDAPPPAAPPLPPESKLDERVQVRMWVAVKEVIISTGSLE